MANEATLKLKMSDPIDFTVADGTGIEKGTICRITDPRTASASTADGESFAGVAAREKIANDGRTRLALHIEGIFDMTTVASPAAITAGDPVKIGGANLIDAADDDTVEGMAEVIGYALETVTATVQETIEVRLK